MEIHLRKPAQASPVPDDEDPVPTRWAGGAEPVVRILLDGLRAGASAKPPRQ
jgi:hypothetical protein